MCGRVCCALCAPKYEEASSYYDDVNDEYKKPSFINSDTLKFIPSTNLSPSEAVPVLVWDAVQKCPIIKPMVWGMIPPWTSGDYKSGSYTTHNCRIENVKESRLYSAPLTAGKRCVILCEGYYEWKSTVGKHKQPCFLYKAQSPGMKPENESHWSDGKWSKSQGWVGPSLTYLAGLYSAFESKKDSEPILSSTVITMRSSPAVSHIHHRMPAILSSPEVVKDWLNAEDVNMKEAMTLLEPTESVQWHEVSAEVNSSKNKLPTCNKPVDTKKQGGKQMSLTSFFKKPKKDDGDDEANPPKKPKKN
ncbi:unnamed protein product [Nezara viridula]|uniref:Abasic site processing protein HMCES n=1 Tax=Nezara viridula TaxID=85310 RepID=A0A9P0HV57_NEZVI|nr:unnamed protein product [Nezara viridula]